MKSQDAYDVNLAMMDAYLDDGVDYFLLLFPHLRAPSDRDLQRLPPRSFDLFYFSLLIDMTLSKLFIHMQYYLVLAGLMTLMPHGWKITAAESIGSVLSGFSFEG